MNDHITGTSVPPVPVYPMEPSRHPLSSLIKFARNTITTLSLVDLLIEVVGGKFLNLDMRIEVRVRQYFQTLNNSGQEQICPPAKC